MTDGVTASRSDTSSRSDGPSQSDGPSRFGGSSRSDEPSRSGGPDSGPGAHDTHGADRRREPSEARDAHGTHGTGGARGTGGTGGAPDALSRAREATERGLATASRQDELTRELASSGVLRDVCTRVEGPAGPSPAQPGAGAGELMLSRGPGSGGSDFRESERLFQADAPAQSALALAPGRSSTLPSTLPEVAGAGRAEGQADLAALGQAERARFERRTEAARLDADLHGAARASGAWTPAEREALDRGTQAGAVDAGQGWVSDVVEGVKEGAIVVGQAAVVGAERAAQALARPPEPTGTGWLDGIKGAAHTINPLTHVGRAVDWAIPDDFADEQAQSLQDKGAAFIEGMRALPDMPAAVVEKFEAEFELADALEGAYRAGRANLGVLEESARVRAQAQTEAGILAAELGATALAGVGAGLKLTRALRQLDVDDGPGGALAAMAREGQASRSLAADLRAFAAGESGALRLGLEPGQRLDRDTLDLMRARRRDPSLGAPAMSAQQWDALQSQAENLGVQVERLSPEDFEARTAEAAAAAGLDRTPLAAFDPATGALILREDATFYQGLHETQHARQWSELGPEAYGALSRFERELFVFERIMEQPELFSPLERGDATAYIMEQARMPYGDPDFRLPAAYRSDYETYLMWENRADIIPADMSRRLDRVFNQ